ncbi:hypothetical protein ACHAO9_012373 [Fusarium lateritium]
MYGGIGGKLIDTSTEMTSLPSYDEAATCPPLPPPIDEPLGKKRPRQNTDSERNDISLLWAELRGIKEGQSRVEAENEKLK